jgi:hypothetical protein
MNLSMTAGVAIQAFSRWVITMASPVKSRIACVRKARWVTTALAISGRARGPGGACLRNARSLAIRFSCRVMRSSSVGSAPAAPGKE